MIKTVRCEHSQNNSVEHPARKAVFIGNLVIEMCETCYNAIKGQVLEGALRDFFTFQEVPVRRVKRNE